MRQVLLRAVYLLRRPWVLLGLLLLVGGGIGLVFVPLFGLPGYELSEALSLGLGVIGGGFGIAAAFQERRLISGRDPRPPGAARLDSAMGSAWLAWSAAFLLAVAAIVPAFVASIVYALVSTSCDPFALIGFFPLLTLPSAAIATAVGALCGFALRRGLFAFLLYAGVLVLSLVVTLWPVLRGPQVFAFNAFLGYLPGPLYDEALHLKAALLWFRLETLLARDVRVAAHRAAARHARRRSHPAAPAPRLGRAPRGDRLRHLPDRRARPRDRPADDRVPPPRAARRLGLERALRARLLAREGSPRDPADCSATSSSAARRWPRSSARRRRRSPSSSTARPRTRTRSSAPRGPSSRSRGCSSCTSTRRPSRTR